MIEHTHTLTKIIKRKKGEEEIFLSRLNQSYAAPPIEEVRALLTPHLKMSFDLRTLLQALPKGHGHVYLLARANNFFYYY
jgi:hypothetical protein